MTKRQTKRGSEAKKLKDLGPKAKAKGVKGGRRSILGQVDATTEDAGLKSLKLDKTVNRTLNPR